MPDSINILLIDDDEEDFILTEDSINDVEHRKYRLDWASSYEEGLKAVSEGKYDVYLVDYRLGGENGLDLIKKAIEMGCKAPLILMTGQGDIEIDEQAMKAGASDYLVKGNITSSDLERSIRYSIKESENVEQIRKLNAELEERVEERTKDLFQAMKQLEENNKILTHAEAEVRKALEKEKELNEMKSRFVTIASHEFRTPLSTILSSSSLVKKYADLQDKAKIEKHSERIKTAVSNLTGILNDFLSLSKLEEGERLNEPLRLNIKDLLEEVKEEMTGMLKDSQVLTYSHSGPEEFILDKNVTKNSVINLVSNAIKYSEKGNIRILSTVKENKLHLSVSDEGIGIPEEDQQFMFQRFFRAKNASNIQGTGLGLNIVKRYIELLKGKITFESTPGKGTTFFIEIPQQHEKNPTD